jgi:hypothetical protein
MGVTIIRGLLLYNLGQLSRINKHFGNTLMIEEPMDMIDLKNDDDSENDGEILYENGGTILVKDWRRTSFFYSICIFKSKVYILIIDSGNYENVVLAKVVKKLQLTIENHSKPYKLTWINKDNELIVDKFCFVSYFMG